MVLVSTVSVSECNIPFSGSVHTDNRAVKMHVKKHMHTEEGTLGPTKQSVRFVVALLHGRRQQLTLSGHMVHCESLYTWNNIG